MPNRIAKPILVGAALAACAAASAVALRTNSGGPRLAGGDALKPAVRDELAALIGADFTDGNAWRRVTDEPHYVPSELATLCAPPRRVAVERVRRKNPHAEAMVHVYVNSTGSEAMKSPGTTPFPVGSIVVKRKFPFARDEKRYDQAELSTVMVKREPGFNPAVGDWEFGVLSGDGRTVTARGKIESCAACHANFRSTGYVAATYLDNTSPAE